eukprot:8685695-Pyramimonas_sp.AAC.2
MYNITSFYGSSCADNGKGALDTPVGVWVHGATGLICNVCYRRRACGTGERGFRRGGYKPDAVGAEGYLTSPS